MLKRRYQLLLLAVSVLAVYYPSIFSELNSVDDVGMVTDLLNHGSLELEGYFLSGLQCGPLLPAPSRPQLRN